MKISCFSGILIALAFTLTSCSENNYKFKLQNKKKVALGEKVQIDFNELNGKKADSVKLYLGKKQLTLNENKTTVNTADFGIGKHPITALAFVPGKVKKIRSSVEIYSNVTPKVYSYRIVNTFPHDKTSYTQGLEYHNGHLYETTGRKGKSRLRKLDIETGKVLQQYDLSDKYFGEGMTIFNNEIFWLTWQARKGFVFDLETFKLKKEFPYENSFEGWGLSHTNSELIKTDGTNKIWFLDPATQKEKRSIQVYALKKPIDKLNEIEYIDGKIYSNYWKTGKEIKPTIAIINAESGIVEALVDMKSLRQTILKEQKLESDDVLNGIAYDTKNNRLFVTGKHWGKLFEIEILKE
ncbi:glutaminyl-peptide cyclotransferase [Tenacibaculum jejuense]|uniref:Putative glutamine cyclotransferase n=1 Tax=Tenacibaculum jejuense TaxID=584609 RepID=A0A238U774_9FLAO|nr:glutaminyl-peptide cyclotransferase [Tenacibaculum jejuense]SNR15051.1 Putative glutamine cyclotransferase precursor [Tenacibaculum jejuense]